MKDAYEVLKDKLMEKVHTMVFVEDVMELVKEYTLPRPLLSADGLPIKIGETVYTPEGLALKVELITSDYIEYSIGEAGGYYWEPEELTHTPPDSREKVISDIQDAVKGLNDISFQIANNPKVIASRIDQLVRDGRWL